jgi:hypothetical protein
MAATKNDIEDDFDVPEEEEQGRQIECACINPIGTPESEPSFTCSVSGTCYVPCGGVCADQLVGAVPGTCASRVACQALTPVVEDVRRFPIRRGFLRGRPFLRRGIRRGVRRGVRGGIRRVARGRARGVARRVARGGARGGARGRGGRRG